MSRTKNSLRNIIFAVGGSFAKIIMSFVTRTVFIQLLSAEYLGLNGLFSNILSMLSLAELGVGTSITYSLYRPLAEDNREQVKSLMSLYRRAYAIIGCIVMGLGLAITPFLDVFVSEMPDIPHIQLIFILFVGQTASSYFFSYKRTLIVADQRQYISTLYADVRYFAVNVAQIAVLCATGNYILYLVVQIVLTFGENYLISRKATKLYPYLKERDVAPLDGETAHTIKKNVAAMMCHKIGGVVVLGTDNLLIAKFVSVVAVGLYSNYSLVINAVSGTITLILNAMTASVGNLVAGEKGEKSLEIFFAMNFAGAWIYGWAAICLYQLINPFITLWIGADYLFSWEIALMLVVNFYLTGMRRSVLLYRDGFGLYWEDRWKPIAEACINLTASIVLATQFGIAGIFLGTTISTITTCFWVEPLVLFKYGFKKPVAPYFKKYALFTLATLVNGGVTFALCTWSGQGGFWNFVMDMAICATVPNLLMLVEFWPSKEMAYLRSVAKQLLEK